MSEGINYYIDESGDLSPVEDGGSKIFMLGCAIVNNIDKNRRNIIKLKKELNDSAFFQRHKSNKYFHACEDHFDIYARYIELLNYLDFRAYIVVMNKTSDLFQKLISEKSKEVIYEDMVSKLLSDRLLDRKFDLNVLIFERFGNKFDKEKKEKTEFLNDINRKLKSTAMIDLDLDFKVEIKNKNEQLLSIIDYVMHIVGRLYEGKDGKVEAYMKHNYKLIEPKIALIYDVAENKYLTPRKQDIDTADFYIE